MEAKQLILVTSIKVKRMERESSIGKMALIMKEISLMASFKASADITLQI